MNRGLMVVCVMLLASMAVACGGSQAAKMSDQTDKAAMDKGDAPAASKAPQGLTITPAKIWREGQPDKAIEIMGDGAIVMQGKPVGTVHSDGRMVVGDGKVVSILNPDGTITYPGEQPMGGDAASITISAEGVLDNPNVGLKVHFDEKGALVGGNPNGPPMVSDGCQGPMARTCMYVFMIATMPVRVEMPKPVDREDTLPNGEPKDGAQP